VTRASLQNEDAVPVRMSSFVLKQVEHKTRYLGRTHSFSGPFGGFFFTKNSTNISSFPYLCYTFSIKEMNGGDFPSQIYEKGTCCESKNTFRGGKIAS
jgi:hypothetical protein